MNIKKMLLIITIILGFVGNNNCAEISGDVTIQNKDKSKNPIVEASCTKQAPSNLADIDRGAPLLHVCVTLSIDKKRDWHYLPLSVFQNKDRSFKKSGDVLELTALTSIKEFQTKYKLKLDESFNGIDLQKKYEEFNATVTPPSCFSCKPCIECLVQ